jgi:hypothetical protein
MRIATRGCTSSAASSVAHVCRTSSSGTAQRRRARLQRWALPRKARPARAGPEPAGITDQLGSIGARMVAGSRLPFAQLSSSPRPCLERPSGPSRAIGYADPRHGSDSQGYWRLRGRRGKRGRPYLLVIKCSARFSLRTQNYIGVHYIKRQAVHQLVRISRRVLNLNYIHTP